MDFPQVSPSCCPLLPVDNGSRVVVGPGRSTGRVHALRGANPLMGRLGTDCSRAGSGLARLGTALAAGRARGCTDQQPRLPKAPPAPSCPDFFGVWAVGFEVRFCSFHDVDAVDFCAAASGDRCDGKRRISCPSFYSMTVPGAGTWALCVSETTTIRVAVLLAQEFIVFLRLPLPLRLRGAVADVLC